MTDAWADRLLLLLLLLLLHERLVLRRLICLFLLVSLWIEVNCALFVYR